MSDLSAYINFTITLDKSGTTPVLKLIDTGVYPSGVPAILTGIVSIVQPDNISRTGSWTTPDISLAASNTFSITLRLASDGTIQNGLYFFSYTVRAAGYTDTVLTKTIQLNYCQVEPVITENFDVFTPQLIVADGTNYAIQTYTLNSVTRSLTAQILNANGATPILSSSTNSLDLIYSGHYWDAKYVCNLSSIVSYTISFVTIIDKITASGQFDAYTPQTIPQLTASLGILKLKDYYKWKKAQDIFDLLIARGNENQTVNLGVYVLQIQRLCNPYIRVIHNYSVIPTYTWNTASNNINVTVLPAGSTSLAVTAGTFIEYIIFIAPTNTNISVGTTPGGNDISPAISANPVGMANVQQYLQIASTVYFTGILSDTVTKIYKR